MSRPDHHTATVEAAAAWEANHSIGAPTRAEEAYDPHPDDAHCWGIDVDPEWAAALVAAREEVGPQ